MYYDINYNDLVGYMRCRKALDDLIDFLGIERFDELTNQFVGYDKPMTLKTFAQYVSITGVQGFPVEVWYAHILGQQELEKILEANNA